MANMNFGVNLLPQTHNTYTLGNSEKKWNLYAEGIGGANLLQRTGNPRTSDYVFSAASRTSYANGIFSMSGSGSGATYIKYKTPLTLGDAKNKTFTFSVETRIDNNPNDYEPHLRLFFAVQPTSRDNNTAQSSTDAYKYFDITDTLTANWKRVSITATIPTDITQGLTELLSGQDADSLLFTVQIGIPAYSETAPLQFRKLQLELGTCTTDWSASPYDVLYLNDVLDGADGLDNLGSIRLCGTLSASNKWDSVNSTSNKHYLFPVKSDDVVVITSKTTGQAPYAVLTDNSFVAGLGASMSTATGFTDRKSVAQGGNTVTETMPADAKYLYVSSSSAPASLTINGVEMMYNIRQRIDEMVNAFYLNNTKAEFIYSTNSESSDSLTGVLNNNNVLGNGKVIYYLTKYATTGTALTLTLSYAGASSSTTATIPIYTYGTTACTSIFPAGTVLNLVYYNGGFIIINDASGMFTDADLEAY